MNRKHYLSILLIAILTIAMLSGSSSDVTVTEEESFAKQPKKKANRKIQPGSVKQKKKYVQNKQNNNMKTRGIEAVVL